MSCDTPLHVRHCEAKPKQFPFRLRHCEAGRDRHCDTDTPLQVRHCEAKPKQSPSQLRPCEVQPKQPEVAIMMHPAFVSLFNTGCVALLYVLFATRQISDRKSVV